MHNLAKKLTAGAVTRVMMILSVVTAIMPSVAHACSVCQGDPNSNLVKGAEAGVLFMVIVTYVLLLGMAALVASWFIRQNRRLRRVQLEGGASGFDDGSNSEPPHS